MRIAVLVLALLPAAALAGERDTSAPRPHLALPATPKAECQNARAQHAAPAGRPIRMRKLGDEPLASGYLTVLRIEDGCDKPVKIADRVGDKQR